MKKSWIAYNFIMVLVLLVLIALDITINSSKDEHDIFTYFTGIALYLSAVHIFFIMPIWFVALFFNRLKIDAKTFWSGFGLFLVFVALAAWPIVAVIGYTAF